MNVPQGLTDSYGKDENALIYVVEDDPNMLRLIAMNLANGPWRVKTFNDPEPALHAFDRENPKPALLLTDYSMVSMDGLQLGKRLKDLHPALKVVLMSGTAESDIVDLAEFSLDAFVAKPFESNALVRLLRSLLSA
jgi:DNA-binding NtrC family response regulator